MENFVPIIVAFFLYFVVGGFISMWYEKKVKSIFYDNFGRYPHEATLGISMGCMIVGWAILLPYELITKFKNWKLKEGR